MYIASLDLSSFYSTDKVFGSRKVPYTLVPNVRSKISTKKEPSFMPSANQTPGAGNYQCTKCGLIVTLKSPVEKLPVCPKCRATEYIRKK